MPLASEVASFLSFSSIYRLEVVRVQRASLKVSLWTRSEIFGLEMRRLEERVLGSSKGKGSSRRRLEARTDESQFIISATIMLRLLSTERLVFGSKCGIVITS